MDNIIIYIRKNRRTGGWTYVQIISTINNTLYRYYGYSSITEPEKSTFNKYSFIEYLKSIGIPKKYISKVEMYEK